MKNLHLICNAHIDPLWQWEAEEGVGAVLSTFRAAADYCEEFDGFVFNHNEAVAYAWVENYEPGLFARIQRLVCQGKWHIMGSWYLQPDCNMPCGESLVRQIEAGNRYFQEKFHVSNRVAVNFDSFGHSRGLVQILARAGYLGYICCRPYAHEMELPARECVWKGFCGSSVMLHRSDSYNQGMGRAAEKIEGYLEQYGNEQDVGLVLWGVGNHGGGPSRLDLRRIEELREKYPVSILHSTPEAYFKELEQERENLYVWERDLNPAMPGCYTSQVRIKQAHRRLENELFLVEKMCVQAELEAGMAYPHERLKEAQEKLLLAQFHDVLPGSSIRKVEEQGLEILSHGLDLLREIKTQAFFSLCREQRAAGEGEYPVFIYNPHPFAVTDVFEVEFMLADQNYDREYLDAPQVSDSAGRLPSQCVKERSNIPIQWRKRAAFYGRLAPFSLNRFTIRIQKQSYEKSCKGWVRVEEQGQIIQIVNDRMSLRIRKDTGYIDSYQVEGLEHAGKDFASLAVFLDNEDPWGMVDNLYSGGFLGTFALVRDRRQAARIAASSAEELAPVRILEAGEVLVKVEAIFAYEDTAAVIQYTASRFDSSVKVGIRIRNSLKNRMVKWMLPMGFPVERYCGKTAFGIQDLDRQGKETVSQEYVIVQGHQQALSVIKTGCYGGHFKDQTLGISLLRGAAYCAHPIGDRRTLPPDRFVERMEQEEREFEFVLNASDPETRFQKIERESGILQQKPQVLSYFPGGAGKETTSLLTIDHPGIVISSLKKAADDSGYLLRLFNSSPKREEYRLESEVFQTAFCETLEGFEIRTLFLAERKCVRTGLIDHRGLAGVDLEAVPERPEGFVLDAMTGDHMVLQRERQNCIWGTSTADGWIGISFGGEIFYGMVENGQFELYLPPMPPGGPYDLILFQASQKRTIKNVLVGEVFLLAGQSNMQMRIQETGPSKEEVQTYEHDRIRLFEIREHYEEDPVELLESSAVNGWGPAVGERVLSYSAAGYYFARELATKYPDLPIGLVMCCQGATYLSTWIPRTAFEELKESGIGLPSDGRDPRLTPGLHYNAMVYPARRFGFKAVLWYQGEGQPLNYGEGLKKLIAVWRKEFASPDLGFVIFTLPRLVEDRYNGYALVSEQDWFESRKQQMQAAREAGNAAYCVANDLGSYDDIHPLDKKAMAVRAAHVFIKKFYGAPETLSGPRYAGYRIRKNDLEIRFTNVGTGLELRNKHLGFEVLDEKGDYRPAEVELAGKEAVRLKMPEGMEKCEGFRYGFRNSYPGLTREEQRDVKNAVCLYNKEGYPAEQMEIQIQG